MPELPEVEIIVRHLKKDSVNRPIKKISSFLTRLLEIQKNEATKKKIATSTFFKNLEGKSIETLSRRGKYMVVLFKNAHEAIIFHLGMSGQVILGPISKDSKLDDKKISTFKTITGLKLVHHGAPVSLDKHCHFVIYFEDDYLLVFRDPRTFGKVILTSRAGWERHVRIKKLGAEPLENPPDTILKEYWPAKSRRNIKSVLLDQTVMAGIGNIYADEALFGAGIHPLTKTCHLKPEEVKALIKEVKRVLKKGIKNFGTTFSNFIHPDGKKGSNYEYLKVYGRGGEPCVICKEKLVKMVISQRGSVFCPNCQRQRL